MKKNLNLLSLIILVVGLSACSNTSNTNTSNTRQEVDNNSVVKDDTNIQEIKGENKDITLLKEKINLLEDKISSLDSRVRYLEQEKLKHIPSVPVEEITSVVQKIKEKLKDYNSYIYQNTFLSKYDKVLVYYGTGEGNLSKKFEVSDKEKQKGIIIFRNLKDNTRYYYKVYGDGELLTDSYFETSKKPVSLELESNGKSENGKIKLKFKKENVKELLKLIYKPLPNLPKGFNGPAGPSDFTGNKIDPKKEEQMRKQYEKAMKEAEKQKKVIVLKNQDNIELTGLDDKKQYEVEVIYQDIYDETGSAYTYLNLKDNK